MNAESRWSQWRHQVEGRIDYLRDDVVRWNFGETTQIYGYGVTATSALAEAVLGAAVLAGESFLAGCVENGAITLQAVSKAFELKLREAIVRVVEQAMAVDPPAYPRGAKAHGLSCEVRSCHCFDYVVWLGERAGRLDPDLQSGITRRALRRAEKGKFPANRPSKWYLNQAYNQLRIDEIRHLNVIRSREAPGYENLGLAEMSPIANSNPSADILASALPSALGESNDWSDIWTEESAISWLERDPIGSAALRLANEKTSTFPKFVREERREAFVAVALAVVTRLVMSDAEIADTWEGLLRKALHGAVGGDTESGGHARRLSRILPPALSALSTLAGTPSA